MNLIFLMFSVCFPPRYSVHTNDILRLEEVSHLTTALWHFLEATNSQDTFAVTPALPALPLAPALSALPLPWSLAGAAGWPFTPAVSREQPGAVPPRLQSPP